MDTATRERVVEEETDRFLDSQFGGLDLSGSPNFNKPLTETFASEDRDGFNRVDCSGLGRMNKLHQLIREPDREALIELAKHDPNLARQLEDRLAEETVRQFAEKNPAYLSSDNNFKKIVSFLTKKHLRKTVARFTDLEDAVRALMSVSRWTIPELEAAYHALLNEGELEVPTNEPRNLTESERLECALTAANGDVLGAVARYLQCRVSEEVAHDIEFALTDPLSFTANPEYRPLLEEAVLFCWQEWRKDFTPTEERLRFLKKYVAGRYMTTGLLDAAWAACQVAEKDATRSALFNADASSEEPTAPDLEQLTDEEIARLKGAALRERARKLRERKLQ